MSADGSAIEHVVLFKWNREATPGQIAEAEHELRQLAHAIPGILDLTCGPNFSERSAGYHTGLVVRFDSRDSLEAYLPHPAHQHVVQTYVHPIRESTIVVDFPIT